MSEHGLCQIELNDMMDLIRPITTGAERKKVSIVGPSFRQYFVEGLPEIGNVWIQHACCKYAARARAWGQFLEKTDRKAPLVWKRTLDEDGISGPSYDARLGKETFTINKHDDGWYWCLYPRQNGRTFFRTLREAKEKMQAKADELERKGLIRR